MMFADKFVKKTHSYDQFKHKLEARNTVVTKRCSSSYGTLQSSKLKTPKTLYQSRTKQPLLQKRISLIAGLSDDHGATCNSQSNSKVVVSSSVQIQPSGLSKGLSRPVSIGMIRSTESLLSAPRNLWSMHSGGANNNVKQPKPLIDLTDIQIKPSLKLQKSSLQKVRSHGPIK